MEGPVLGWDVGGANVKVARAETDGTVSSTLERPFALWRERDRLPAVLLELAAAVGPAPFFAITMTGELADCFATKREGVTFILDAFRSAFEDTARYVYGVDGRFHHEAVARERPRLVAAANWRASAELVAMGHPNCFFVDVGSTTTDIIPIVAGRVQTRGRSDPARLHSGELVYTGLLRTPICAVVRWLPLRGRRCRVAAEHFAISADVYRWLERIHDNDYSCDTPDGRGRTRHDSAARIARMICDDLESLADRDIDAMAQHVMRSQIVQITSGLRQVMRRLGQACPTVGVAAGQGAFLGRAAAEYVGLGTRDFAEDIGVPASRTAPAAAVARLLTAFEPHGPSTTMGRR